MPRWNNKNCGFQKGHKIGKMFKGRKLSKEHKEKIGLGNFKGDNAGYHAIHIWVSKWKGKPRKCEMCGTIKSRKYEWANVDHKYRRVLEDYIRMCTKCHRNYDYNNV